MDFERGEILGVFWLLFLLEVGDSFDFVGLGGLGGLWIF